MPGNWTPEARAAQSLRLTGLKRGPEALANIRTAAALRPKRTAPHLQTPESRAAQGAAMRGRPKTAETRAKMSAARIGKKLTALTKQHMSEAQRRLAARRAADKQIADTHSSADLMPRCL